MPASAVRMTVRWSVPFGEARSITDALHRLMTSARSSPGCTGCSVATDAGRQVVVQYVEEWCAEDLLRRELRSDRFATLATLMERATCLPLVEFILPEGARGLDYVEEVRAAKPE